MSGAGRGRGWLNLSKNPNQVIIRPGAGQTTMNMNNFVGDASITSNNPAPNNKYLKVVAQIQQLSPSDDGILFNRKLALIKEVWEEECSNSEEIAESFKYLFEQCMQKKSNLGSKVVTLFSTNSFKSVEIHGVNLRRIFIGKLQENFENARQIQKNNLDAFRNSIKMFSEYFYKSNLTSTALADPLIQYFYMILDTPKPEDVELFAVHFSLNGSILRQVCPQELKDLLIHVRHFMACSTDLTTNCRIWLLLCLDAANHRFGPLPRELQDYYSEQLGDRAMARFQGTPKALSVRTTFKDIMLDGFQSNVSVLQVSSESTSPISEHESVPSSNNNQQQSQSSFSSDAGFAKIDMWDPTAEKKPEKTGRPILGAGARLNKPPSDEEGGSTWKKSKNQENAAGWNSKQKNTTGSGWGGGKKTTSKIKSKGWEHDDRFDTDYD